MEQQPPVSATAQITLTKKDAQTGEVIETVALAPVALDAAAVAQMFSAGGTD